MADEIDRKLAEHREALAIERALLAALENLDRLSRSASPARLEELRPVLAAVVERATVLLGMPAERTLSVRMSPPDSANPPPPLAWRPGHPITSQHPFPLALDARGITVKEWAKRHGVTAERVRSWYSATDPRRIPRWAAEAIEREFGLPATIETWPQGIRD